MTEPDCNRCSLHGHMEACLSIIKIDVKDIERSADKVRERIAAIEPTIEQHEKAILVIQKMQLGTLVSALISAIGVMSGLAYALINHME